MYPSVQAAFPSFTRPLEGDIAYMYADELDLVTCAWGNLIDSVSAALDAGRWLVRATGLPATTDEVADEWRTVKAGRIPAWRGPRPLYLSDSDVIALAMRRLQSNESFLAKRWPNWSSWPADAQLGAHSCAWAAGAGWAAPHFDAAVRARDFMVCAGPPGDANTNLEARGEAWLRDGPMGSLQPTLNPGLRPRNLHNKLLFQNAARVLKIGLPLDVLCWPNEVPS